MVRYGMVGMYACLFVLCALSLSLCSVWLQRSRPTGTVFVLRCAALCYITVCDVRPRENSSQMHHATEHLS